MSYLHDLTRAGSSPSSKSRKAARTKAAVSLPLTAQQEAVAASPLQAGITQVVAYAGTGKTSSLCALAARQSASSRCLYLAFNKSAQQDAAARFGSNTRCITVHALAFASHGKRYAHKLGQPRTIDIIRQMDLRWDWKLADMVSQTVAAWCVSDWETFPDCAQSVSGPVSGPPHLQKEAATVAAQVWSRMCDPQDAMAMPHDGYLKLYQLSRPRIECDLLMLDEAQDTNPVTWSIVSAQQCPIILVGDRYQSIYQFRGAINAMERVRPQRTFALTQSFRFGPRVARIASELLAAFHHEAAPVEGLGPDTVIGPPPDGTARAVLARTNASVFHHAVQGLREGQSLGFVGGVAAYGFEKLLDAYQLSCDRHDLIRDSFLRNFPSFGALCEYAKQSGDLEAKRQIEIVEQYGAHLEQLIPQLYAAATSDLSRADLVLATAHRAKGLTMDHVVLAEDYPDIIDVAGVPLEPTDLDRQEINLLYVAVTRARLSLQLNQTTRDFLEACGAWEALQQHRHDVGLPSPAGQNSPCEALTGTSYLPNASASETQAHSNHSIQHSLF